MAGLHAPLTTEALRLKHRVVLAPLTRNRAAEPTLAPRQEHVDYYSQRASDGGLLITEATAISPEALAYVSVPGIWTQEQVDAWKPVVEAVHKKGSTIFCQLWHTGRVAHSSYKDHPLARDSANPPGVSASAVNMSHPKTGEPLPTDTYQGVQPHTAPRPLRLDEMARLRRDYERAAKGALAAGFDGVELHAAHGYLVDQFLQNGVNQRRDEYGGSVENRCRLLFELVQALTQVVGPRRLGVRLSPTTLDPKTGRQNQLYFAATTSDPDEVYAHAVRGLNQYDLAYLFLTEPRWTGREGDPSADPGMKMPLSNHKYRQLFKGTLMAGGGFTPSSAEAAVREGHYDLIAFGRWFISNPDLPERLRTGADLNVYNRTTFYTPTIRGGGAEGYTDYPDFQGTFGAKGKYKLMSQSKIGSKL